MNKKSAQLFLWGLNFIFVVIFCFNKLESYQADYWH